MSYISICLRRAQGLERADASSGTDVFLEPREQLYPMSQPLLDYALEDAFDHFGYLGSTFGSALHDVAVLAEDIQQHSRIWDNVCIPERWIWDAKPHWPAARHDLLLYVLVAFAPSSFMSTFFRCTVLKPKEGTNPLVYAAYFNKDKHARALLS